ncbi:MAG: T9SS type A sorting domain-containing protein [Bacteroidetes bacterium]|nr:T9SS type A sorting domain-containing protein [Bacteroidota bacterium]
MGDPASKNFLPENDVVVTSFSPDTISPWQPVQISGEIHDRSGALMTSLMALLDITMFKPKTLRMTLGNDSLNLSNPGVPTPFMVWDDTLYNATVNVVNGAFSLNFIMPINIDSGFGAGRIAFYANDGVVDAMGCYQNFVLENLTSGIDEYSNVQIQLFPNPSTDKIKCALNNVVAKDWSYTLTGIDGRKLRSEKIVGQEFFIERNSLTSGIYFLKIVDAKGEVVRVEKVVFE